VASNQLIDRTPEFYSASVLPIPRCRIATVPLRAILYSCLGCSVYRGRSIPGMTWL
jgi:hypothetical protein